MTTSPPDPSTVPLPPGDDTAYFNTPQSSVFAATPNTHNHRLYGSDEESTPQTTRTLPPFRHPDLAGGAYSSMNTPTPANMLGSDIETPRGRPQRRGGKYHPGAASVLRRNADISSSVHELSQSSGPDSGSDEEDDLMSEEEEALDNAEYENLDQTVAVNFHSQTSIPLNMSTPLQRQFPGLHYSARSRHTGRSSPGQTPARKLLANSKNFFEGATPVAYQKNTKTFLNPDILPSAFSEDTLNFPCLSAATPHKLNTIQSSPVGVDPYQLSVENSQLSTQLREKDAKIRYLEDMLSGGQPQNFDDFFDFSPEKKLKLNPIMPAEDAAPLTIKKRRQSPKKATPSPRKARTSPRKNSRSPVKLSLGLFESIMTPVKLTAEERKEERRRRETREFREFSAIDLEMLKSYLPPAVDEEQMEDVIEEPPTTSEASKSPVKVLDESAKINEVKKSEAETTMEISKREITVPPTPVRQIRQRRSNSAPPVPATLDARVQTQSPTKPAFLQATVSIASLQARVAQLEEELETTSISLQRAVAALEGERRARISAEETWRFLEVERKFGACCQFAQAASRNTTEAAATVPIPSSPAESVRSAATYTGRVPSKYSTQPPSRMQSERPESRMTIDRPSSRMGRERSSSRMERERPPSRMERDRSLTRMERERPLSRMERERGGYGGSESKIGVAPVTSTTTGKKRLREESANSGIGMRKAPIPRQAEKRVLSGGVGAANVPLGGGMSQNGGALKKPALGAGVGAPPMKAPVRSIGAAGGTRSMTGLARGARR